MAIIIPPHHRACRMKILLWAFILCLPSLCTAQAPSFTLGAECVNDYVNVVQGQPRGLTCSGLTKGHNIYWSITPTSGVERRLAQCVKCDTPPLPCNADRCSNDSHSHTITRTDDTTTLGFTTILPADSGAVIKCSSQSNHSQVNCTLRSITPFTLAECHGGYFDVVQGQPRGLTCSDLTDRHNIYWSITATSGSNRGVERRVAECRECYVSSEPCTSDRCSSGSHIITRTVTTTTLGFTTLPPDDSGADITCSNFNNNTIATCKLRSNYRIPQCHNGTLELSETQPQKQFVCESIYSLENIYWKLSDDSGTNRLIADCYSGLTCSSVADGFTATRSHFLSTLVVENYTRETFANRTLTCERRGDWKSASCNIRVIYPADHSLPSVTLVGWEAVATVDIHKVFDSHSNVSCVWVWTGPGQVPSSRVTRPVLSPFVDPEDRRTYYRGTCRDTLALDGTEGPHRVSVTVTPGENPASKHTFHIARPGLLITDPSSCPPYVAEHSSLSCLCLHPDGHTGYPTAEVTWQGDGGGSSVLDIGEVGRRLNGNVWECRSVWGHRGEVSTTYNYTLLVATRPTAVTVTAAPPPIPSVNGTSPLFFFCTAPSVLPSVTFTWSLPCVTLNHIPEVSTCAVSPEEWRHVTEVVCLAVNSAIPSLNMTGRYRRPGQMSGETARTIGVGAVVGVTAAGMLVVFLVVVVVVWLWRRQRGVNSEMVPPAYPAPTRGSDNPRDSAGYEVPVNTRANEGEMVPPAYPAPTRGSRKPRDSDDYEVPDNTLANVNEGEMVPPAFPAPTLGSDNLRDSDGYEIPPTTPANQDYFVDHVDYGTLNHDEIGLRSHYSGLNICDATPQHTGNADTPYENTTSEHQC